MDRSAIGNLDWARIRISPFRFPRTRTVQEKVRIGPESGNPTPGSDSETDSGRVVAHFTLADAGPQVVGRGGDPQVAVVVRRRRRPFQNRFLLRRLFLLLLLLLFFLLLVLLMVIELLMLSRGTAAVVAPNSSGNGHESRTRGATLAPTSDDVPDITRHFFPSETENFFLSSKQNRTITDSKFRSFFVPT